MSRTTQEQSKDRAEAEVGRARVADRAGRALLPTDPTAHTIRHTTPRALADLTAPPANNKYVTLIKAAEAMTGKYLGILVWQTRRVIAPPAPLRGRQVMDVAGVQHRLSTITSQLEVVAPRETIKYPATGPAAALNAALSGSERSYESHVRYTYLRVERCVLPRSNSTRVGGARLTGGRRAAARRRRGSSGPRPRPARRCILCVRPPTAGRRESRRSSLPLTSAEPPDASPYLARTQLACHLCVTLATD